jgi:hypothetical protein
MQRLVAVLKPLLGSTAGDAIQSATTSPTDSIFPHVDFEDFVLGMENLDLEEEAEDNSLDISVA